MMHHNTEELLKLINSCPSSSHYIFDIDSTLVHLHKRNQSILHDFLSIPETKDRFPKQSKSYLNAAFKRGDWGIKEALKRHGLGQEDKEFFSDLRTHWLEKFFSNEFLHEDVPIDGAIEFTNEIINRGFKLSYLTGRNRLQMLEGTLQSLKNLGFPLDDDSNNLHMKPRPDLPDEDYKKNVLGELLEDETPVLFFENEPVNLNMAAREFPNMHLIFMDTTHSGQEEPPNNCFKIKDFKELASQLKA